MTLGKLIKTLQKLEEKHGPRVTVAADTRSLRDSCNDVWQIVNIRETEVTWVDLVDGDGFKEYRKDGQERMRMYVVLK